MSVAVQQLTIFDQVVRNNVVRCGGCGRLRSVTHDCPRRPVQERFNKWVSKGEGCWPWTGDVDKATGYGRFWFNGKTESAHRVAYELARGPIPKGLHIDHLCRNRICVKPDHLEPVTLVENVMRGEGAAAINARKVACHNGHPLSGDNLHVAPDGRRICRQCARDKDNQQRRALGIPARPRRARQ